jgi:ribosomal protein L17
MPSNPGVKNIGIPSDAHYLLSKEAKRLKISQAEYTAAAVRYFAERGLHPIDDVAREGQLIMQQIKKLGDRLFGFLQVQERSLIEPMLEEMLRTRVTLERALRMEEILVNNLTQQLGTMTPEQINTQREAGKKLRAQNEEMIERQIKEAVAATRQRAAATPPQGTTDSLS